MRKIEASPIFKRQGFLALGGAALLILSFPSFNQAWCAWVALVPWLLVLRSCTPRDAFRWSYLIGCLFFVWYGRMALKSGVLR